jgi:hypothetical protein
LNKDWKEEYGGHLELWNREVTQCEAKILPVFNRLTVFGTTDFTFHGHPNPLLCPEGMTRKSLALYYFTNGRPAEEINGDSNTTLFKPRDADDFKPTVKQRLGNAARAILPPILMRQFERRR